MKRKQLHIISVLITATGIFQLASAQIVVNSNHLMQIGNTAVQATDTMLRDLPAKGANKTWNFSNLKAHTDIDSLTFTNPNWRRGFSYFPNSNLAFAGENDSSTSFCTLTATEFKFDGIYNLSSDGEEDVTPFSSKILTFPSTMGTKFTASTNFPPNVSYVGFDFDDGGILPRVDSLKVEIKQDVMSEIVGWGNLTIPLGTYSVLQQELIEITSTSFKVYVNGTWITPPKALANLIGISNSKDTSYNYYYWTNNSNVGVFLMNYSVDMETNKIEEITFLHKLPFKNNLLTKELPQISVFPNPANDKLYFSNSGAQRVEVLNLAGQKVAAMNVTNNSVSIGHLKSGLYQVQLLDKNNSLIGAAKFMRQ